MNKFKWRVATVTGRAPFVRYNGLDSDWLQRDKRKSEVERTREILSTIRQVPQYSNAMS